MTPFARRLCAAAALAAAAAGPAPAAERRAPVVESAWARASAGMARAGAGFLTIRNDGAADRLVGASAGVSRKVEIHTHVMDGAVMRMRRVDAVPVAASATTALRPGGDHLMFIGLHAPLKEGGRFPVTLIFEKAGAVTVSMEVRGVAARARSGSER